MKIAATLMAATLALTMVPFASATPSVYDENVNYLTEWHPAATPAQVAEIAGMLTAGGINLGAEVQVAGAGGLHAGEIWGVCQDVGWFFGGVNPCGAVNATPTGVPCASIPAHWALYIWTPSTTTWTTSGGTPGFSPIAYYWTEGHAGVGPIAEISATSFQGSGCAFEYRFAPGDEVVFGYGNGVAQ